MNHFSVRLLLLFVGLCFSACNESPEAVALGYTKALGKGDYKLAQKYCSPETAKLMGELEQMLGKNPIPQGAKDKMDLLVSAACTFPSANNATCLMCCGEDGKSTSERITLRKDSTRWFAPWRVHLEKNRNE
jgi:Domain of unknown function (DUF4878)